MFWLMCLKLVSYLVSYYYSFYYLPCNFFWDFHFHRDLKNTNPITSPICVFNIIWLCAYFFNKVHMERKLQTRFNQIFPCFVLNTFPFKKELIAQQKSGITYTITNCTTKKQQNLYNYIHGFIQMSLLPKVRK